jgi:hypothetical protein
MYHLVKLIIVNYIYYKIYKCFGAGLKEYKEQVFLLWNV